MTSRTWLERHFMSPLSCALPKLGSCQGCTFELDFVMNSATKVKVDPSFLYYQRRAGKEFIVLSSQYHHMFWWYPQPQSVVEIDSDRCICTVKTKIIALFQRFTWDLSLSLGFFRIHISINPWWKDTSVNWTSWTWQVRQDQSVSSLHVVAR